MNYKILLLSYPRSGNSFVKFFLKRSIGASTIYDCEIRKSINKGKPFSIEHINNLGAGNNYIFKEHFIEPCKYAFNQNTDGLILILRNYKECIVRHGGVNKVSNRQYLKDSCKNYTDNVNYFNDWGGRKIVLYYEDLIVNFKDNFDKLLPLVNIDKQKYNDLFSNFEKNKSACLNNYNKTHGSFTKGKSPIFHSEKINKTLRLEFDETIKSQVENTTYISRYFEGGNE